MLHGFERKSGELCLLRPVLCCVVDAHDLDCFIVEAVNRDVGQRRNHQLASALDTSAAAKVGERSQVRDSTVESEYDISCRFGLSCWIRWPMRSKSSALRVTSELPSGGKQPVDA